MGPRPVHRPLCWERLRGILLRPGRGYAPFNDECGNFLGDPDGFRAKDHLPVPLQNAIQTFLCGGSRLPFGSGAIPFRVCKLAKRRSKRFCAEDRGFLSEAVQFPFGFVS